MARAKDSASPSRGRQIAKAVPWPASMAMKFSAWWLSLLGALLTSFTTQLWARFWPATILGLPAQARRQLAPEWRLALALCLLQRTA